MIAGRSAAARSSRASSTLSATDGLMTRGSGAEASASANTTSSGKSRNTGPVGWLIARSIAAATALGISAGSLTVPALLTSGLTKGKWSISWRLPEPQRISGARPPRTTRGERLNLAPAIALIPLVTPGPAVSAQTPTSRVAFAQPSAAQAAEASWRVSMTLMPSCLQPS